jgi:integrase
MRQITEHTVASLVQRWRDNYKPNTVLHKVRGLKNFLIWTESFGAPRSLRDAVPYVRKPRPRQTIATAAELAKIKAAAPIWMRLFILLCHDTALRFSEAATAAPLNYDPQTRTLTFRQKGGDQNTLPVSDELASILAAIPEDAPRSTSFIEILRNKPIAQQAIHQQFHRTLKKAGANTELTPHDLRRTRITNLYIETKDLRLCQQLAGHREMWQTAQYVAHCDTGELRAILEQKPYVVRAAIKKAVSQ